MKDKIDIEKARISCVDYYDNASAEYFKKFADELMQKPYDSDFLTRLITPIKQDGKILDIGCCSTAQQARFFHDNGYQVTSIDLSKNCIETAKQNFPRIDFRQMNMLDMDFELNTFDGICAFYSIIHIPDEKLDGLFSDFNKILKLNGLLAIAVHAGDFYGYYDENEIPVFFRNYTQGELKLHLDKHGFEIIEMKQRLPIYDFEFQSERIYLIAKKIKTDDRN